MKTQFRLTALLIFTFFSFSAFAQKVFTEGSLTYRISIESVNGEAPLSGGLNGATLTVYLTKDKSRSEMQSVAGNETTVFDDKSNKGFILKEYSGQKLMITFNDENRRQKNMLNSGLNFNIAPGNITVGDYTTRKAEAKAADGKTFIVYYDPSVQIYNKTYNNAFPQIPGLPVQYELRSGNMIFKYTLVKYSNDAVALNKFDAPHAGFRVMTFEENQQLKKGD